MKTKLREISAVQLALLLVVGRMFMLMTFSPRGADAHGATALAAVPVGAAIVLLAGIPALLLYRRAGCDILQAAARGGEGVSFAACAAFGLFCIASTAMTGVRFGTFMTSAVYPDTKPWMFLLGLIVAGAYAARMGLEPVARLSFPVFLVLLLAGGILYTGLWKYCRWEQVISPVYDGWNAFMNAVVRSAASYGEAALFLLLIGRVKKTTGSEKNVWWGWLALAAAVMEGFVFIVLTALGEYAGTRLFPLHAAAAAARIGPLGRLDLIFLFLWVFAGFLRAAVYLYGGCVCLKGLAPGLGLGARVLWTGGAAVLLSILATRFMPLRGWLSGALESGIWLVILLVGFPVLLLLTPRAKIPRKEEEVV